MGTSPTLPAPDLSPALRRPSPLPDHARLLALDEVWMEGEAIEQLARAAERRDCVAAVGMPDLHAGPGIPIGAALAFGSSIHPHLVGGDAGCGARVVGLAKLKLRGDALERRVREQFAVPVVGETIELDPDRRPDDAALELLDAVWRGGARAIASLRVPDDLAALAEAEVDPPGLGASAPLPGHLAEPAHGRALGTIGGGNHFVELGQVGEFVDADAAAAIGLDKRGAAIVAHSGSRGLGRALAAEWGTRVLTAADDQRRYLGELAGAVRFAAANRLLLAWRMLEACGMARTSRITGGFDLVHNDVQREPIWGPTPASDGEDQRAWLHRKGCAPARAGDPTIVLGSRGAPSWIMRGCGNTACLCSIAHGAGRRMTRTEAKAKVAARHTRASLTRTATGRVVCDDKDLLYEEHPDAYKPIAPVIASLELAGAATRVAALEPLVTVKTR